MNHNEIQVQELISRHPHPLRRDDLVDGASRATGMVSSVQCTPVQQSSVQRLSAPQTPYRMAASHEVNHGTSLGIDPDVDHEDDIVMTHDAAHNIGTSPTVQSRVVPAYDGTIRLELSNKPVHYHISGCIVGDMADSDCQNLALSSCRIACMAADIIRGRHISHRLHRAVSGQCIRKLETLSYLLDNHLHARRELKTQLLRLPAVPQWMEGMWISETKIEIVVLLSIGTLQYLVNLVLSQTGSRWLCTMADMG